MRWATGSTSLFVPNMSPMSLPRIVASAFKASRTLSCEARSQFGTSNFADARLLDLDRILNGIGGLHVVQVSAGSASVRTMMKT